MDHVDQIFCPSCGYNLVGVAQPALPSQECPECGARYGAVALMSAQQSEEISGSQVLRGLAVLPTICLLCSLVPFISLVTMPIAALVTLIVGGFTARRLTQRIVLTQARHRPIDRAMGSLGEAPAVWIGVGLWLAQVALAGVAIFGGCAASIAMLSGGRF